MTKGKSWFTMSSFVISRVADRPVSTLSIFRQLAKGSGRQCVNISSGSGEAWADSSRMAKMAWVDEFNNSSVSREGWSDEKRVGYKIGWSISNIMYLGDGS
jgi:hypothetical protein